LKTDVAVADDMTEVGPADRLKLLRSKQTELRSVLGSSDRANFCDHFDVRESILTACSSIVTSRKRKLRELFAVATDEDGIPNLDFSDPDAQPTTAAEAKFLFDADILQYVSSIEKHGFREY
jgi:chromatin modification-related protein VID21